MARSPDQYDIIQITQVESRGDWLAAASANTFYENSLYTKEAMHDYIVHLKPGGFLSITRYRFDEALRLTNLIIQYLEETGVRDVHERLAIVSQQRRLYYAATILLKNGPLDPQEAVAVLDAARQGKYNVVYAPGTQKEDLEQSDDASLFRSLIQPVAYGNRSRAELVRSYPRNITPPTDDKPFFFFMTYLRDTFRINPAQHAARRLAMPIVWGAFGIFSIFSVLTVFVPLYLSKEASIRGAPCRLRSLSYFAALGVGYMLIELSLIQRLTVFLGHPAYAFVVVVATLLLSSGVGSLASGPWDPTGNPGKLIGVLGGIVALGLLQVLVVYDQFIRLMWMAMPSRILLAVLVIAPPGFLMGMCVPMGMQIARKFHEYLVPWGWGVNGACSTFGSVLSMLLALHLGLKASLFVGVMCYAVAFVIILSLRRHTKGTSWARDPTISGR